MKSIIASEVVAALLEYGRIDYGEDEYGRTRWTPQSENYWVSPNGEIIRVPAHRDWATENVLQSDEPISDVYARMKALGWVRATVEDRIFYANTAQFNGVQQKAVDYFVAQRRYTLQHATIA